MFSLPGVEIEGDWALKILECMILEEHLVIILLNKVSQSMR